ncbi:MAG TPA: PD-(D/E)XK nuclease family protein, partial [Methylomirabilota bacterium]|nr:PD-(D/E)XK nuclease family protein [Methylomirabilota bacterium]
MPRRPLERRFSWSVSRDRLFQRCPRAYWYQYYGSWGGWEAGASPEVRELYVLKHLQTRHQWVGAAVHATLEQVLVALRDGRPLSPADACRQLTFRMRGTFDASRRGRHWREPKAGGLVEHEYHLPVTDDEWRALHAGAVRALTAAFDL